jgi:DNA polymerase I
MIATIDADIVAYRCAASCDVREGGVIIDSSDEEIALLRVEQLMQEILHATEAGSYRCFLSPSKNFRYEAYPEYKANRKDTVDPTHRKACKQYLVDQWNGEMFHGYEADDALAWSQTNDTIICSIDKDLKQVPGMHYNFVKQEFDTVSDLHGDSTFYQQVLIGDKIDNLFGLKGIGPKKAAKYLEGCYTEQEMFNTVYDMYEDKHQLAINLVCMWLCREQGVTWLHHQKNSGLIIPNEFEPVLDQMSESMKFFTKTI